MADIADLSFDRVTYREGQRLTARDLQDDRNRRTRLRRLHLRSLHETWGIAAGFAVQAVGSSNVGIGPGYAVDDSGRELVLSSSMAIPVPAVAGPQTFALVAMFLNDRGLSSAGAAACLQAPLHSARERPAFAWRTPTELEPGPMVPLCHVVVHNQAIEGGVQTKVRRQAQRFVRPYIATGATDPEPGPWKDVWHSGEFHLRERSVSTVEAGFTGTPQYFARLVETTPSASHSAADLAVALAEVEQHIVKTAADSFVFRVLVRDAFAKDLEDTWAISWMGVEPREGCPPEFNPLVLLTVAGLRFNVK